MKKLVREFKRQSWRMRWKNCAELFFSPPDISRFHRWNFAVAVLATPGPIEQNRLELLDRNFIGPLIKPSACSSDRLNVPPPLFFAGNWKERALCHTQKFEKPKKKRKRSTNNRWSPFYRRASGFSFWDSSSWSCCCLFLLIFFSFIRHSSVFVDFERCGSLRFLLGSIDINNTWPPSVSY